MKINKTSKKMGKENKNCEMQKTEVPRVRIELTTFRFLISDYETDALPTALTRHT